MHFSIRREGISRTNDEDELLDNEDPGDDMETDADSCALDMTKTEKRLCVYEDSIENVILTSQRGFARAQHSHPHSHAQPHLARGVKRKGAPPSGLSPSARHPLAIEAKSRLLAAFNGNMNNQSSGDGFSASLKEEDDDDDDDDESESHIKGDQNGNYDPERLKAFNVIRFGWERMSSFINMSFLFSSALHSRV